MKTLLFPTLIIMLFAGSRLAAHLMLPDRPAPFRSDTGRLQANRIVSVAPSLTETLFALGLDERVVGRSTFCTYPPEAMQIPAIGGYYDMSYERIVALRPDLVVMQDIHVDAKQALSWLVPDIIVVSHKTLYGIIESIAAIGERCGKGEQAREIVEDMSKRIESVRRRTPELERPRVLISIGSDTGSGTLNNIYIAGNDGFFNEMLELAGGKNAYVGRMAYPIISAESIISLNPDVIIEMAPGLEMQSLTVQQARSKWLALSNVAAVRNGRIHILTGEYVNIPGPRFVQTLEDIAAALHPEE